PMSIIGIDTGGTFTDLVRLDPGSPPRALKVPSTPEDPAAAVLAGLAAILGPESGPARVVHGTTVATNALLEHVRADVRVRELAGPKGPGRRRLARTALVTNRDMEDLVEIGRQARPDLY